MISFCSDSLFKGNNVKRFDSRKATVLILRFVVESIMCPQLWYLTAPTEPKLQLSMPQATVLQMLCRQRCRSILSRIEPEIVSHFQRWDKALLSVQARDEDPRDSFAILLPSLAILLRAALLISPAAMNQQNCHEYRISPGKQIRESASSAHRVR
jgi:hypothetical protein